MANTNSGNAASGQGTALASQKYLTFSLGEEEYGLDIMKVDSIIGMMSITRVPKTPVFIRGVINLRGKVIPIIDLRIKFDMDKQEDTRRTSIIVLNVSAEDQEMTIGVVVDEVSEVRDIDEEHIQPPPSFGSNVETRFIIGIGRLENKVILLLDADKIFSADEVSAVKNIG